MFLGAESGQTIAVISSLIASCRRHNVDPQAYLQTVIQRLMENPDPATLMPDVLVLDVNN